MLHKLALSEVNSYEKEEVARCMTLTLLGGQWKIKSKEMTDETCNLSIVGIMNLKWGPTKPGSTGWIRILKTEIDR